MPTERSRGFCFTLNNYTQENCGAIDGLVAANKCRYVIYQKEIAPTSGTPHLQGYVYFDVVKSWQSARDLFVVEHNIAGVSIRAARGNAAQNIEYCSKDDSRAPGDDSGPYEFGSRPVQGKRKDLDILGEAVISGRSATEVAIEQPGQFIRYHRGIQLLASIVAKPRHFKTDVYWYYGGTGTGKSHKALTDGTEFAAAEAATCPNESVKEILGRPYYKMGGNKWWDGYIGQSVVIIDDFRPDNFPFDDLLRLCDKYPYRVEAKGSSFEFVAKRVYITCPKKPADCYESVGEDIHQLLRRITDTVHFATIF